METAGQIKISKVYTLAMPKYVRIQIRGVQESVKVLADKVEETTNQNTPIAGATTITLTLNNTEVGKFNGIMVDGWWFQDER